MGIFPIFRVAASGWPTGKNKFILIPTWYQYYASGYRDLFSHDYPYPDNGLYRSSLFQLYGEYGLSKRLDFVGSIPYYLIQYRDMVESRSNKGLGDLELGLRYNLLNKHDQRYLSIQVSGIVPLYHNDTTELPFIGFGDAGAEARLMYSGSLKDGKKNWYFNTELAFREYFDLHGGISQISLLATAGLYLNNSNVISVDISGMRSNGNNEAFNPINLNGNTNFYFLKGSFDYGHRITKHVWAYGEVFHDFYDRNTGIGKGFSLMLIYRM